MVSALSRRFLGASGDVEDAVQEIFLAVWQNAAKFDSAIASEATFISMLARRRLIDRVRRLGRRPKPAPMESAEQVVDARADSVEEQFVISAAYAEAADALHQLRPEPREVLRLSIYEGWSHQQISEHLQLPLGTVKTHARRGLLRIREQLGVAERSPETRGSGAS